jgi:hypothetical protein
MRKLILTAGSTLLSTVFMFAQQNENATAPTPPAPQSLGAMQEHIKELEERIRILEQQMRMLQNTQVSSSDSSAGSTQALATASEPQTAPGASTPEPTALEGATAASRQFPAPGGSSDAKVLNPDISVIGDFIGKVGRNSASRERSVEMHESEVGFQAIIDPYARGDFFVSFAEHGVDLEEGYMTFTALPAGLVMRTGKMRASFGKVNLTHNHALPWVDRPLVTTHLVAGEEGISDAGVSVSRIIPAPKGLFVEATGQLFRGDSGDDDSPLFRATRNSDVSVVGHLRGYVDINEATNLDLGLSYARGHNELGSHFLTRLFGFDGTLRWKPLRRSIYRSFVARTELVWSRREELPRQQDAFGFYVSAEYQLLRRWFLGGRYDWSGRSRSADLVDQGGSAILTYWPSEFSLIRGQYRVTRDADNTRADELLMQVLFSLGAHGAHPF